MTLKKPGKLFKKLTADDLKHPRDQRSPFNGDKRRPTEEQGFAERRAAQGLTTDTTPPGSGVRRTYFNGQLVEEACTENVPVARPVIANSQPKRMPVALRETGEVQTSLPPNLRPIQRPETNGQ